MTNLCGHDQNKLLCVLRWAVSDDARGRTKARCECGGPCCVIYNDLLDPAKLAEMLATEARRCGYVIGHDPLYGDAPDFEAVEEIMAGDGWMVWFRHCPERPQLRRVCGLSQARAILLQCLQLPDGAREEAERILRGET